MNSQGYRWMLSSLDSKENDTNDNFFGKINVEFFTPRLWGRRINNTNAEKRGGLGVSLLGRALRFNLLFVPHKRIYTTIPNAKIAA